MPVAFFFVVAMPVAFSITNSQYYTDIMIYTNEL